MAFRETLEECDLYDLGFLGQWFTWERGRLVDNNIRERLDRGVANSEWWERFPKYLVKHLPHGFLDHCPVFIRTNSNQVGIMRNERGVFRFNAYWALEDQFED